MGFDLHILLHLRIDANSGLPIVYANGEKNGFHDSEYQVPAEYRRFIAQKGNWFSEYVMEFEGNNVSAEYFLEHYPDWGQVLCGLEGNDWKKEDHDDFRKALEWFSWKGNFIVTWSY